MIPLTNGFSWWAFLTWERAKRGWSRFSVQEIGKELLHHIQTLPLNLEKLSLTARQAPPLLVLGFTSWTYSISSMPRNCMITPSFPLFLSQIWAFRVSGEAHCQVKPYDTHTGRLASYQAQLHHCTLFLTLVPNLRVIILHSWPTSTALPCLMRPPLPWPQMFIILRNA